MCIYKYAIVNHVSELHVYSTERKVIHRFRSHLPLQNGAITDLPSNDLKLMLPDGEKNDVEVGGGWVMDGS